MSSKFEKIAFPQIYKLIELIYASFEKKKDFIEIKYQIFGGSFNRVLPFLKDLKLVLTDQDRLLFSKDLSNFLKLNKLNEKELKLFILSRMLTLETSLTNEIVNYLNKFKFIKNNFEYSPTNKERLAESDIRNFLIDLDFVEIDMDENIYRITDLSKMFSSKLLNKKELSEKQFLNLWKMNSFLGKLAEIEIVKYEKKRLREFPQFISEIKQVSIKNVNAGYDIKSFDVIDLRNGKIIPRYIEVKAVSLTDFKFYWSKNEIDQSKLYKKQYYLYLLPVIKKNEFSIRHLKIINDPYETIFKFKCDWAHEVESFSIWKQK